MPEELYEIESNIPANPIEEYLRMDRMPHIWCPGCGIGTTVNCFVRALQTSGLDLDKVAVVSGIGCTGRVAGYMNLDSFHTTHGRAIPFATGLKLANPEMKVVVYSGDGDLTAIGGNHFIHAARRNMDLTVILINNMIYGMTGGQVAPTTPVGATASTTPHGNFEETFNLPFLAESCGAVYVLAGQPTMSGTLQNPSRKRWERRDFRSSRSWHRARRSTAAATNLATVSIRWSFTAITARLRTEQTQKP
jgi:pyruvate/2-oxoacid:ferredoxin oxidoreductase beta subunit